MQQLPSLLRPSSIGIASIATTMNRRKASELDLESLSRDAVSEHSGRRERVVRRLNARQMPPAKRKSRPTEVEYESAIQSLVATLDAEATAHPAP